MQLEVDEGLVALVHGRVDASLLRLILRVELVDSYTAISETGEINYSRFDVALEIVDRLPLRGVIKHLSQLFLVFRGVETF